MQDTFLSAQGGEVADDILRTYTSNVHPFDAKSKPPLVLIAPKEVSE
jgi:hypothetical protein